MMRRAPKLRFIQKWGAGYDRIDVAAAERLGITVAITAGVNAHSVAEHAVMLMLSVAALHSPGRPQPARRTLGTGRVPRALLQPARQDRRHRRLRPDRPGGGGPRRAVRIVGRLLQSVRSGERRAVRPRPLSAAAEPVARRRCGHFALPRQRQDARPDRPRGAGDDEAGRGADQYGARQRRVGAGPRGGAVERATSPAPASTHLRPSRCRRRRCSWASTTWFSLPTRPAW